MDLHYTRVFLCVVSMQSGEKYTYWDSKNTHPALK